MNNQNRLTYTLLLALIFLADKEVFSQDQKIEIQRATGVIRSFHNEFESVYISDNFYLREEIGEYNNVLRNLYRVTNSQEYIVAAYNDSKIININNRLKNLTGIDFGIKKKIELDNAFEKGIVFTNKKIYSRINKSYTWSIPYVKFNETYKSELIWNDDLIGIVPKKGGDELLLSVSKSNILPAEMSSLIQNLIFAFSKEGIRQEKALQEQERARLRKKRAEEKRRFEEQNHVIERQKQANELFSDEYYIKAFSILNSLKESEYFSDQNLLGYMYLEGLGTQMSLESAEHWLLKVAESNSFAQNNLGYVYYRQKKYAESAKWCINAASAGITGSQNLLGDLFLEELVSSNNPSIDEAEKYYSQAAHKGNVYAMKGMGNVYEKRKRIVVSNYKDWLIKDEEEFDRKEQARKKDESYFSQVKSWATRDKRKVAYLKNQEKEYKELAAKHGITSKEWFAKASL